MSAPVGTSPAPHTGPAQRHGHPRPHRPSPHRSVPHPDSATSQETGTDRAQRGGTPPRQGSPHKYNRNKPKRDSRPDASSPSQQTQPQTMPLPPHAHSGPGQVPTHPPIPGLSFPFHHLPMPHPFPFPGPAPSHPSMHAPPVPTVRSGVFDLASIEQHLSSASPAPGFDLKPVSREPPPRMYDDRPEEVKRIEQLSSDLSIAKEDAPSKHEGSEHEHHGQPSQPQQHPTQPHPPLLPLPQQPHHLGHPGPMPSPFTSPHMPPFMPMHLGPNGHMMFPPHMLPFMMSDMAQLVRPIANLDEDVPPNTNDHPPTQPNMHAPPPGNPMGLPPFMFPTAQPNQTLDALFANMFTRQIPVSPREPAPSALSAAMQNAAPLVRRIWETDPPAGTSTSTTATSHIPSDPSIISSSAHMLSSSPIAAPLSASPHPGLLSSSPIHAFLAREAGTPDGESPRPPGGQGPNDNNHEGDDGEGSEQGAKSNGEKKAYTRAVAPPPPTARQLVRITEDTLSIFKALRPAPGAAQTRSLLLQRLQRLVADTWPALAPRLYAFGSSGNDFCFNNGDLDLCLTIKSESGDGPKIVERLAKQLKKAKMLKVLALPRARVPIVKFTDPQSKIACDICVNNVLALENTRLVADYARIDPRVRILGYVVKYWAKRRGINEPYQGTLSSYAYLNLVINYLQTRSPPILPSLQILAKEHDMPTRTVEGWDSTYFMSDDLIGFGQANTETAGELVSGFFREYGFEFDFYEDVASVRTGTRITKESKDWTKRKEDSRDYFWFTIEDPFELSHNLGRLVDKENLDLLRYEFRRAYKTLSTAGDLYKVCQRYVPKEEQQQ
eukprot:TRINITY_DN2941_c0_g1_i1.p1 TRINITY_DN2941_c0_g1~~TRINITY_DN2941_c0_g1_i1.p1  ORF type:complete len:834 (+),score=180.51 TRINITY_DN2941_c0_g1_i1:131-2632(+)